MCPSKGSDCAASTLGSALAGPGPINRRGGICRQYTRSNTLEAIRKSNLLDASRMHCILARVDSRASRPTGPRAA